MFIYQHIFEPIIWNERTGHIVGGHQRFKILKQLGAEYIDHDITLYGGTAFAPIRRANSRAIYASSGNKATGRSVNITLLDREMYKSGIFSFEDLWNIYLETDNPDYEENAGGDDDE